MGLMVVGGLPAVAAGRCRGPVWHQALQRQTHRSLIPHPRDRMFPPPGLPTHCLSPPHSSGMLTGTLPGNQMPACCCPSAAFQQHLRARRSVLCPPVLQTPRPSSWERRGPCRAIKGHEGRGEIMGGVLASVYKEPHLTCSPWSPRDTPGVGTRVHPIYQWGD